MPKFRSRADETQSVEAVRTVDALPGSGREWTVTGPQGTFEMAEIDFHNAYKPDPSDDRAAEMYVGVVVE